MFSAIYVCNTHTHTPDTHPQPQTHTQTFPYKTDWQSDVFLGQKTNAKVSLFKPRTPRGQSNANGKDNKGKYTRHYSLLWVIALSNKIAALENTGTMLCYSLSPASSAVATKQAGSYGCCLSPKAREREALSLWGSLQSWHMGGKSSSPSPANHTLRNPTWSSAVLQHETNDFNQWNGKFQTLLPPGLLLVWCNCGFGVYKPYPFLPGFWLWISFWYGPALDHRQIKYSWSALHWVAFSCVLHGYHKMFFSCPSTFKGPSTNTMPCN